MLDEEIQYLRRLRSETQKRYNEQSIQAARYGPSRVPAEIAIELREAEESLRRLDAKLLQVTVPQKIQDATGPESSVDVLRHEVKRLGEQVGTMWRYLENLIIEGRDDTHRYRAQQAIERAAGIQERRAIEILLAIGVIVAIYLALKF